MFIVETALMRGRAGPGKANDSRCSARGIGALCTCRERRTGRGRRSGGLPLSLRGPLVQSRRFHPRNPIFLPNVFLEGLSKDSRRTLEGVLKDSRRLANVSESASSEAGAREAGAPSGGPFPSYGSGQELRAGSRRRSNCVPPSAANRGVRPSSGAQFPGVLPPNHAPLSDPRGGRITRFGCRRGEPRPPPT